MSKPTEGRWDAAIHELHELLLVTHPTDREAELHERLVPLLEAVDLVVTIWEDSGDAVHGARELAKERDKWLTK